MLKKTVTNISLKNKSLGAFCISIKQFFTFLVKVCRKIFGDFQWAASEKRLRGTAQIEKRQAKTEKLFLA